MLILFEGIDGSGKSTLAKSVAEKINAEYVFTPPVEYLPIRKKVHNSESYATRFLFYLSSSIFLSDTIKRNRNKVYVCDRYYHTSLADCNAYGKLTKDEINFFRIFLEKYALEPDLVFHCICERSERLSRISNRHAFSVADDISIEFERNMIESLRSFLPRETIDIDTSTLGVHELTEKVIFHLNQFI